MPFVFIIIGVVFLVSGVRGTSSDLVTLVRGDFTGKPSYLYWVISILVIGSLGYIPQIRPFSRALMGLLIIVMFLSNGGFFDKFNSDLFGGSLQQSGNNNLKATGVAQ